MVIFLAKRAVFMVLTMIAVSILLILLLEVNVGSLPTRVLGPYITEVQAEQWLEEEGYNRPIYVRYFEWVGDMLTGDFGYSTRFQIPVSEVLWERLGNTALLAFFVFALMVRPLPNWGWVLVSGAATMVLAMVLWSMLPLTAGWLIGLFLGATLISQGVALAYFAWTLRRQEI